MTLYCLIQSHLRSLSGRKIFGSFQSRPLVKFLWTAATLDAIRQIPADQRVAVIEQARRYEQQSQEVFNSELNAGISVGGIEFNEAWFF